MTASFFEHDFLIMTPEVFLLVSSLVLLGFGLVTQETPVSSLIRTFTWLSLFTLACTLCVLVNSPIHHAFVFSQSLLVDDFTFFFKTLLLMSSFGALLISKKYLCEEKIYSFEYILFLLFSTLSMLLMIFKTFTDFFKTFFKFWNIFFLFF